MRTAIWIALLLVHGAVSFGAGIDYGRKAEREDLRSRVNQSMAEIGFCEWLKVSRFAEDCADRDSRVLVGGEADD